MTMITQNWKTYSWFFEPQIVLCPWAKNHNKGSRNVTFLSYHCLLQLADVVQARSEQNRDYGVVLLPEGLIESVPDVGHLFAEMNDILAQDKSGEASAVGPKLSASSQKVHLTPITISLRFCFQSPKPVYQYQILIELTIGLHS